MSNYIQDEPTCSKLTVPVKTIGWTHEIRAAVRSDEVLMRMAAIDAAHRLKIHAAKLPVENGGFVVTATDDPSMAVRGSLFVREVEKPSPRRWWHRLFFLHPTEQSTEWDEMAGDIPGADYYRIGWEQHVVECPQEMAGRIRQDSPRPIVFVAPPPDAFRLS